MYSDYFKQAAERQAELLRLLDQLAAAHKDEVDDLKAALRRAAVILSENFGDSVDDWIDYLTKID